MEYSIKRFTAEDQKAFLEEHELGEPKEWAVMDGSLVYGFYDTEEEAATALAELERDEKIGESFSNWEDDIADELDISLETVRKVIKDRLP